MRLKTLSKTPPSGWVYYCRKFDVKIEAESWDDLLTKTRDLYRANRMTPPDNLAHGIMEYICLNNPAGVCLDSGKPLNFSWRDLYNGTQALIAMIRQGKGAFVSKEEANRRAKICSECEDNIDGQYCKPCVGIENIIMAVRGNRSTDFDDLLYTCRHCKCFVKALVHVDFGVLAPLTKKESLQSLPENCWKRKLEEML